jgi:hypothetical protein
MYAYLKVIRGLRITEQLIEFDSYFVASLLDDWMSAEHWWNDTDRRKPKCWKKNLSQCHFADHKSHMDWRWTKHSPTRRGPRHGAGRGWGVVGIV